MCLYYYHFLEVEFAADLMDFVLVAVVAAVAEAVLSVDHHADDGDDENTDPNLVSRALVLLQDLHGVAAKLHNAQLMDTARQFVLQLRNADSAIA